MPNRKIKKGQSKRVCEVCIEDDGLKGVVRDDFEWANCDFCPEQMEHPMVCDIELIVNHMRKCIDQDFCGPADLLDGCEFPMPEQAPFAVDELFERIGLDIQNDRLWNEIATHFSGHLWSERRWYSSSRSGNYRNDWLEYSEIVKSHAQGAAEGRLQIDLDSLEETYPRAIATLKGVSQLVRETGIARCNPRLWRVQVVGKNEAVKLPDRLTSPPAHLAKQPNRMSPAGVSMFYGADDLETAYKETVTEPLTDDEVVLAAQFESVVPLELLDLTHGMMRPSYFGERGSDALHEAWFFDSFREEVSRPIERDGQPHVEYAPTQVMTEYFRSQVITLNQNRPDGIAFASSRTGRKVYVVFVDQSQCLDGDGSRKSPQLLRMVACSVQRLRDCAKRSDRDGVDHHV